MTAWGREGALQSAEPAILHTDTNRIEYRRGTLTEWYLNDERGLEQGFTIQSPLLPHSQAPLLLELSITDDLTAHVADDPSASSGQGAQAIEFTTSGGVRVLRYSDLHATDAAGRELPIHFQLPSVGRGDAGGAAILITVDDGNAAYPITIDPLAMSSNWTAESDQGWANFGTSVGTAGDVNNDGYADVIVGAHYYDNGQTSEGRAFVYHGSASGLSASPNWTAESNQDSALFGGSVGTAGDVNGDGYADVIVGADYYSNAHVNEGRAFVYHGSASGLSATPNWIAESDQAGALFGISVGTAGDANGDGYADVIVGAHYYDNGQTNEGRAFVYHGSSTGLTTGAADWTAESNQGNAYFGNSVGTAGDVNGDGYADVIVGAYNYDNGESGEGRAFVYHGSSTGLATGSPDWTAESNQSGAYFGISVGTAGDVDGDGYADVIVGASGYDNGEPGEGRAFVYHGSSTGLTTGSADWTAESNQGNAYFGNSVGTAGDVNGDGYADVIVGAYNYDNGESDEGGAFVYHGSASGLSTAPNWTAESNQDSAWFGTSAGSAGDVNGDGYADVIVGASDYDNGQTNEGRAFVYQGSGSGVSLDPDWTAESNQGNAYFGNSVGTAGDVNGDGYADVIVGAYNYDNGERGEGRAFVYHGSATGLTTSPADWTAESDQAYANFGVSVGTAGDVNGDGYSDVIVGAYYYDNGETDEGRAFVYHGSSTGLTSGTADWTAESDQVDAWFGTSVGTAGDVNGDGYSDVIVGAYLYDSGEANVGRAFVYHGSPTGLTAGSADWTAEADQAVSLFGISVGTAGDVNGDSYADVIVGASAYDNGEDGEGRAFVYHGSPTGLTPGAADWTAESNQVDARFGSSVGTAGDVNGDGYADVIVGASKYDDSQTNEGRAYVFHGSSTGLTTGSADWTAESNQGNAYFGNSVGTAGDVNGDGYADVIVGAARYDIRQGDEGGAFIYHGSASGPSAAPNWIADGNQGLAGFGGSVATAGDVNGDGYADIIVGAGTYNNIQNDEGAAFVFFGAASGPSLAPNWAAESDQASARFGISVSTAGDVNGDGYSDVIVGAYYYDNGETDEGRAFVYHGSSTGLTSGTADWTAESDQVDAWFGTSVGTAGDVDGDGYSDVIVGAYLYDSGEANVGRAFVYHGSPTGLTAGSADWTAEGNQVYAFFGISVGTAGDVNGDGYADVIVGASAYDNGEDGEGRAFVYHGSPTGLTPGSADWTAESNQVDARFGSSVGTAGDVNGDGYSDVIVGANEYPLGQLGGGRAYVYHGSSTGLTTGVADWTAESDQAGAWFGSSVGTAGDVNGDGYSDVIVGAHHYDHGQTNEGRAFVYHGSASGLSDSSKWTAEGDQSDARFGTSVGTAGDVNGDGYAEVIVGASHYHNSETYEGRAFVYHGSSTGLTTGSPDWTAEGNQVYAFFGTSVGTAGDVNGDGYAEVIVGADSYDHGEKDEGRAFVYYGNRGAGLSLNPRQRRGDDSAPVAPLGLAGSDAFRLALLGRTPFGRGKVKLEWEVKPLGTPFDGTGRQQSAAWMDSGTAGVELVELVDNLAVDTVFHWRVRLHYHPASTPFLQYSRWLTVPWNGWNEADLRTGSLGTFIYLPMVIRAFP